MQLIFCLVTIFVVFQTSTAFVQTNWLQHEAYPCVQCLCHARSGCFIRQNCARYSISASYWSEAGGLTVSANEPNDETAYRNCMRNENCIVGTIIRYTDKFGEKDCNCDGKFDCKDRLAIHLSGEQCANPTFTQTYADRFNNCANNINHLGTDYMFSSEGNSQCTGSVLPDAQ